LCKLSGSNSRLITDTFENMRAAIRHPHRQIPSLV
jgi:hypothetical protein